MSYLLYIGYFGAAVIFYLWLRDFRIFLRTGLPGFRKASYYGVFCGAIGILGVGFLKGNLELLGLGIILGALYLQGRVNREKIWTQESTLERIIGNAPLKLKKK